MKDVSDILIYLYIGIFSAVANNAYNLITVGKKVKFSIKDIQLKHHLKPLLLILGLYIASSMYTLLDVVLLGFLSDPRAVGLYSAAVKLTKIVIPFITSVGAVTMPVMALHFVNKNYTELQTLLNKSLHFILFFSIPSFVGLALLAPEFIILFSGVKFLDGTLSMRILSLLPLFIGLGYFWGVQILISSGKDKEMVYAVLGGMIVAISLNLLLVPNFRDVGAAIANVVTELVVTLIYIYFVKRHFSFNFKWTIAAKSTFASALFIPIVLLTRKLPVSESLHLFIAISLCGTSYLFMQGIIFKDHLINELYHTLLNKIKVRPVEAKI